MKNRLNNNNTTTSQIEAIRSGNYQSTKNGSLQRETTPNKGLHGSIKASMGNTQNIQPFTNAASSGMCEDRKKLFNTFMKEMNNSLINYQPG